MTEETFQKKLHPEMKTFGIELKELESQIIEHPEYYTDGKEIVKRFLHDRKFLHHTTPVNLIPMGQPGVCHQSILVVIGSNDFDKVEIRILETIEHLYAKCYKETTFVVFWAASWDGTAWMKHSQHFQHCHVTLKMFAAPPVPLY